MTLMCVCRLTLGERTGSGGYNTRNIARNDANWSSLFRNWRQLIGANFEKNLFFLGTAVGDLRA